MTGVKICAAFSHNVPVETGYYKGKRMYLIS